VPAAIVTDNLKAAVIKSSRYEPTINETFADFAGHYGTAASLLPTDKVVILPRNTLVNINEIYNRYSKEVRRMGALLYLSPTACSPERKNTDCVVLREKLTQT